MGKGSTTTSGVPTFRSGNIVTPPSPKVTQRKSVKKDIIAPDVLIGATAKQFWYGNPSIGEVTHGPRLAQRESLDSERANARETLAPAKLGKRGTVDVLVHKKALRGVVRTLDMGDDTLPRIMAPVVKTAPKAAPVKAAREPKAATVKAAHKGKGTTRDQQAAQAARAAETRMLKAYLMSRGYTGPITAQIRTLTLDALAHAQTVAAYMADR